jgi:2-C-methyl-D-erythritol 4-phosphate cytidylyltransferase
LTQFAGVIAAAGASRRMAAETKKEYLLLEDRPLLAWAVEPFLSCPGLLRLIVVVPEADRLRAERLLASCLPLEKISFVAGGTRRQDSVHCGLLALKELDPEIVLIHDGARPYLCRELIERVAAMTRRYGACIPVQPALEAAKLVGASGLVVSDLPRSHVMMAQTPQGFRFSPLLAAYARAGREPGGREYFDDAEIYNAFAGPVHTIAGEAGNRKITYPQDLPGEL